MQIVLKSVLTPFLAQPAAQQAVKSDDDERNAEQLPLIETYGADHGYFPAFLHFFKELHHETEHEDGGEAVAEEESRSYLMAEAAIKRHPYNEEQKIGHSLVKLSGMTWKDVTVSDKYETVVRTGVFTHYFGIHEVAQTDAAGRYRSCLLYTSDAADER